MSNLTSEFLKSYRVRYGLEAFVETGCYRGDGIASALSAGYRRAYSCEVLAAHAEHCRSRFASVDAV